MAGGRPQKTLKDLPKNWKTTVLALMSNGASQAEVKAKLSLSNDLFSRLIKDEIEFSETIKKGMLLREAWWEKKGRENLENKNFSPVLWYMNMKNRFGWKDKQEVEHSGKISWEEIFSNANTNRTNSID